MTIAPKHPGRLNLKKRLLSGGAWVLGGFVVNAFAGLVVTALLTRILAPAEVGLYFLAFSLVITGSGLIQIGLNRSVVRLTAEAMTLNQPRRARDTIGKALLLVAVLGGIVALMLNTGAGRELVDAAFPKSDIGHYLLALSIWLGASALRSLTAESFRGLHDYRMAALGQRILPNILLAGALTVIWLDGTGFTIGEVFFLAAAIALIVFAGTGLLLLRRVIHYSGDESIAYPRILHSSLPLFISQALALAMAQAPIWILGATQPEVEIANFGTAMRLAMITSMPLLVANNVIQPTVASLYSADEHTRLSRVMSASVALISLPAILLFLVFALGGTEILTFLFGRPYGDAHATLVILSAGLLINVLSGSATVALAMSGHERHVLKSAASAAFISVAASIVLVPRYGAEGAAFAASLGLVMYNALLCWHSKAILGLKTYIRPAGFMELVRLVRQQAANLANNPK
ncbi:MAG: oligosaccharide flippase family protein [Gammaproteobacteria bacterium]|nr:oligosaccharide flippase family protein [Gammaproteobacteria bacterium]